MRKPLRSILVVAEEQLHPDAAVLPAIEGRAGREDRRPRDEAATTRTFPSTFGFRDPNTPKGPRASIGSTERIAYGWRLKWEMSIHFRAPG
jgi:hypothetical protein